MSFGNTFENDLLELILNAQAVANVADNAGTSPLTNLYISLHTADPGEAGDQTTNEVSYTGYARVAIDRTGSGWTITDNSASPVANVDFAQAQSGDTGTITHAAVGTASTGTGKVLISGALSPNITIADGVIPRVGTGSAITLD
jgi:hypothetical protein